MPTTLHGRTTLEKAWQEIISGHVTEQAIHKTVALALVSIALSLRVIAASANQNGSRRQ